MQSRAPALNSRRPSRHGFTLIELLLVLAILVILASLAVMNFTNILGGADRKGAYNQIKLFEQPLRVYFLDTKQFPSTQAGLDALLAPPSELASPEKWKGPYLEQNTIPKDPWNRPYQYASPGVRLPHFVDIWSFGPDGIDGTEDDIGNWSTP